MNEQITDAQIIAHSISPLFKALREVRDKVDVHAKIVNESSNKISSEMSKLTEAINKSSEQTAKSAKTLNYLTAALVFASFTTATSVVIQIVLAYE